MKKNVVTIPAKTINDAFTISINKATDTLIPFKVSLSDEEKVGKRSMAEGREGYARLVSKIATQHPNSLSRADNPIELSNLLDYSSALKSNRMAILQALETVEELELAVDIDVMTLVDRYSKNLQISRDNDGTLDLSMREVDEWNKRFGVREEKEENTTPDTPIS